MPSSIETRINPNTPQNHHKHRFERTSERTKHIVAFIGEFWGTTLFLFFALGGVKTAIHTQPTYETSNLAQGVAISGETIVFISTS